METHGARYGPMDKKSIKVNQVALKELLDSKKAVSYKQLCEYIGLKEAGGNQKIKQLKDLEKFCKFKKAGTKFEILKVFDVENEIELEHGNNCFDKYIKCILFNKFLKSSNSSLYLTNTSLIMELKMVNDQFKSVKNNEDIRRGAAFKYHCISRNLEKALEVIGGNILGRWAKASLERISKQEYYLIEQGFQYATEERTNVNKKPKTMYTLTNVPIESDLHIQLLQFKKDALEELGLKSEKMSPYMRKLYNQTFNNISRRKLNGQINNLASVWSCMVIYPTEKAPQEGTSEEIRKAFEILNQEAIRKCKQSKQLDFLTGTARENIINGLIKAV